MKEFKIAEHEAWYIENMGLYRGHLYAVTFSAQTAIRCGYVLLNDIDNYNLENYETIVNAHGGILLLAKNDASYLFQDSDLQHHRIIGWDYNHLDDGHDFATAKEYAAQHPELKIGDFLSIMERAYAETTKPHATCEEVSKDCMSVIDDIVYHRETGKFRWAGEEDDVTLDVDVEDE